MKASSRFRLDALERWTLLGALLLAGAVFATLALVERQDQRRGFASHPYRPAILGTPTVTPTGTLRVHSSPSGGAVYLDGRYLGKSPIEARDVPFGPHVVRVRRFAFEEGVRSFVLDRPSRTLRLRLRELPSLLVPGRG